MIYLDYAKTFDKVDNQILLAKAKRYGIKGKNLQWLTEFLKDRLHTVVVEGTKPSFQLVISGYPKEQYWDPYYTSYISTTNLIQVFADDTKLIQGKIMDLATKSLLQDDLFNVIAWALKNNMQLNEAHAHPLQNHGKKQTRILLPGVQP